MLQKAIDDYILHANNVITLANLLDEEGLEQFPWKIKIELNSSWIEITIHVPSKEYTQALHAIRKILGKHFRLLGQEGIRRAYELTSPQKQEELSTLFRGCLDVYMFLDDKIKNGCKQVVIGQEVVNKVRKVCFDHKGQPLIEKSDPDYHAIMAALSEEKE